MPKRNDEEYVREYIESHGCKLLSKYENNITKLKIKFPCGHVDTNKTFSCFRVSKKLCSVCGSEKFSFEYVKKYIEEKGCKLLSKEYILNVKPLEILFSCGHIGKRAFSKFKDGKFFTCAKCIGNVKYTTEEVRNELAKRGYKLLDKEYKNAYTNMRIENNEGYRFYIKLAEFRRNKKKDNSATPQLYKYNIYSIYDISLWLKKNGKTFIVLKNNKYKTSKTKLKFKCLDCKKTFYSEWNTVRVGAGCPNCFESHGEKEVKKVLKLFHIKPVTQKRFPDCKYKTSLRFDFYLKKLNLCIEFHGPQHYKPVDFAGKGIEWAKEEFKKNKKRDKIKVKYCKDNGIPLLVIPYWDFDNIESILSEALGIDRM